LPSEIKAFTRQALANSPYNDELLARARPPQAGPSIVPREVGAGSPIKHVIYIIKENRTYDQVLGDLPQGNGDPRLCIFGRPVTPNHHKIVEEFDEFEKNFASPDPAKRLPNFIVMSLGENHTRGTTPGAPTPVAAVANNDWALGQLIERVSHSRYWPQLAIFVIEDDAQNGPDHVDARRTVGLVVSPYARRKIVDSTMYTTSSMVRTIELLLGLPPMTQYDAAAMPMYASFGVQPDLTPYRHLPPEVDVNAKNSPRAPGAKVSLTMDFSEYDRTPMFELNEIIWKSVRGEHSEMPLPISRFHFRY